MMKEKVVQLRKRSREAKRRKKELSFHGYRDICRFPNATKHRKGTFVEGKLRRKDEFKMETGTSLLLPCQQSPPILTRTVALVFFFLSRHREGISAPSLPNSKARINLKRFFFLQNKLREHPSRL